METESSLPSSQQPANCPCTAVVPNLRLPPKEGLRGSAIWLRQSCMEKSIIMKKSTFLSKFKQNDWQNVITEAVFINFKHVMYHMLSISKVFI
jgi:hypothetical protein